MAGSKWNAISHVFCIKEHCCEAYHYNQNLVERRVGNLQTAIVKLFQFSPAAPIAFWCFALQFLALVRNCCLARKSINWWPASASIFILDRMSKHLFVVLFAYKRIQAPLLYASKRNLDLNLLIYLVKFWNVTTSMKT